jgi:uncharacterized membrane protein YagU involved in acid resistance
MDTLAARSGLGPAVVAGIIGGLIFAGFEMIATAVMMGPEAAFMPLRMIGGIALGAQALDPSYPLITAAIAGVLVHMVLSIAFAIVFAVVMPATITSGTLTLLGIGFGIALWVVNFFVIAPVAGWNWFPEQTNPIVQALAHGLFFGAPVAWYLARSPQPIVGHAL